MVTIPTSWNTSSHTSIDLATAGDVALIVVGGELDASTASGLVQAVDDALLSGTRAIEIDLSGVTFIDSTAITAILSVWPRAIECRVGLTVVDASRQVRRVIAMVGLDGMGPFAWGPPT